MPLVLLCIVVLICFCRSEARPLTPEERAERRRQAAIDDFYCWSRDTLTLTPSFKSSMDRSSCKLRKINEPLKTMPALVADLLNDKEREWLVLAMVSGTTAVSLFHRKGRSARRVPLPSVDQLLELARLSESDTVLCFHNHPGGALAPSGQDLRMAKELADSFRNAGVALIKFVCASGDFVEYYRSIPDERFPLSSFLETSSDRTENSYVCKAA